MIASRSRLIAQMEKSLICIVGPTAVGKTEISIRLAQHLNAEIISLDSRQIYRQMTIGTAKPTLEQQRTIRHYLIDCVDVDQPFSVADYQRLAEASIAEIRARNKEVLIVGGAGLYFRALIDGLFEGPGADFRVRARLLDEATTHGTTTLHERLRQCDPHAADRIHPNNLVRVIRALEIYELTGKPISVLQQQWQAPQPRYSFRAVGLNLPREMLYDRIEARVDLMIEKGLIEEVERLLACGYSRDSVAMQSFGYQEFIDYLDGKRTLEEAAALLKQNTRRFAKRQLTSFRRDSRITWIDLSRFSSINQIMDNLLGRIAV